MKIGKGQKRPKVFTLEFFELDKDNGYTVLAIFSTPATATRYLKQWIDKGVRLERIPCSGSTVMRAWKVQENRVGYRIVKHTVDGRLNHRKSKPVE